MKFNLEIKSILLKRCNELNEQKIKVLFSQFQLVHDALLNETKSSAGDKYETSREILQSEKEKIQLQLAELKKNQVALNKIKVKKCDKVEFGSIVFTDSGNFFIAPAIGKLKASGYEFYTITFQSPLGKIMIGKSNGDGFSFGNKNYNILNIL